MYQSSNFQNRSVNNDDNVAIGFPINLASPILESLCAPGFFLIFILMQPNALNHMRTKWFGLPPKSSSSVASNSATGSASYASSGRNSVLRSSELGAYNAQSGQVQVMNAIRPNRGTIVMREANLTNSDRFVEEELSGYDTWKSSADSMDSSVMTMETADSLQQPLEPVRIVVAEGDQITAPSMTSVSSHGTGTGNHARVSTSSYSAQQQPAIRTSISSLEAL